MSKPKRIAGFKIWSLNRWLRWTGFRVAMVVSPKDEDPTSIELCFYGWDGWRDWKFWRYSK